MADIRFNTNPGLPAAPATQRPAARADAQKAFFQQALGGAAAPAAPASRLQAAGTPVTPLRESAPAAEPQRYLRPGSLLDIKV